MLIIDPSMRVERPSEIVFLPEAGARFPGLVGQTIVLGAVIASLIIWGTQNKQSIKEELEKIEKSFIMENLCQLLELGLDLVFVSNILMIAVQSIRLEVSPLDAIQTDFGNMWIIRMSNYTVILLGIWFGLDRKKFYQRKIKFQCL